MDKFEKQFEDMDVQSQAMDQSMSNTVTLSIPEVQRESGGSSSLPSSYLFS